MCYVDVVHDWSGPGAKARVKVRCSLSCSCRIGLWLHLEFGSDVRVKARLNECYSETWVMSIFMVGVCSESQG